MARTPLFRHLRRSLALARAARITGESPSEIVERFASRLRPTRREVLVGASITAAGLALGCTPPRIRRRASEVLVLGGGIAGLTCAYRLAKRDVPVRVLEAQDRAGGRMWSLRGGFPEDQVCELGGELIDTDHEAMHRLAGELGIELDDFDKDDPNLAADVWYFDGRRVSDAEVVAAFTPVAAQIDAAWETVSGETITYREPNGADAIDHLSIAEWLDGAGCQGWFRKLLDVAYNTEYGLDIGEQSAWNLLNMIDTEPDPFKIFGDSDERFHVRGGNDRIPLSLAAALSERLELGVRVESIRSTSAGGFEVEASSNGRTKTYKADHVVVALPFTRLREIELAVDLPAAKRRAITELGYGTNAKLMVGFSERVWRAPGVPGGPSNGSVLSDLPFQLVWESTRLQPGKGGILVCYTGGQRGVEIGQGTPREQAERFTRDLEPVFPGIAAQRTHEVRFHWPTFEWAKGSYACYRPGQWTTICGAEGERVGNLHFAGEHTSYDFQGFMEGGCESGERAAREVLVDLGLELPA